MIFGKKAQLGTTMTWFVAFIIIIFIIFIFLIFTSSISLQNIISFEGDSKTSFFKNTDESLSLYRVFFRFIDSPVGGGKKVADLFFEENFKEVEGNFLKNEFLKNEDCHLFSILDENNELLNLEKGFKTSEDFGDVLIGESLDEKNFEEASFEFYSHKRKLNVLFYVGKC